MAQSPLPGRFLKKASLLRPRRRSSHRFKRHTRIPILQLHRLLHKQLRALRALVPYFNSTRKPSVILDALEYRELLKKQIQQLLSRNDMLKNFKKTSYCGFPKSCFALNALADYEEQSKKPVLELASGKDALANCTKTSHCEIEVVRQDDRVFGIHASFNKNPRLLTALMSQIEDLAVDYKEVNISCQGARTRISAFGRERHGQSFQADEVKRMLMEKIEEHCNSES